MNIKNNKIRFNFLILENIKQAKHYLEQGKLSEEELKKLIEIDPSKTKKYVGWLSKIWINEKPDFDDLRNNIKEFDVLLNKGKTKTKDIYQFKDFKDFKVEIKELNDSGENISIKELETDYETIVNNSDLLIMVPHTHDASRKLGLSYFTYRKCKGGGKDSAWCTTYKAPDHFNDYYYKNNVTFFYIKIKSENLIEKLKKAFPTKYQDLTVVALVKLESGEIDGYDGLDHQMNKQEIQNYMQIIGVE